MRSCTIAFAVMAALALAPAANAQLDFTTAPDVPNPGTVTLNGQAQTTTAQMSSWTVADLRVVASGWHVTSQGDSGSGKSAVFKEYCTDGTASNGCNTAVGGGPGPGYVTDGFTLPAGSLTLNSTGADFTGLPGTVGTAPSHLCSAGCALDSATAVSVASIATGLGLGTWLAQGYSSASVSLATPSTLRYIGAGNKVYRVNLLWTLASGP